MKSDNPRATFSRISAVCDERCPRGTFLPTVASPTREGGSEGGRERGRESGQFDIPTKPRAERKRKKLRASGWQTHWLTTKALLTKKGEEEEEEKPKEEEVSLSK